MVAHKTDVKERLERLNALEKLKQESIDQTSSDEDNEKVQTSLDSCAVKQFNYKYY